MTDALTVSAIQYEALDGGILPNVQEHVRLIEDAESHGARLVVFPELSLTGCDLAAPATGDFWLLDGDPRLGDLHEICRRTGITAVVGAAYRQSDGTPRLASLAIHPDGAVEFAFTSRLPGRDGGLFAPGDSTLLLELDGWRIALAISSDAPDPAHALEAARAGADVYAVSALLTDAAGPRLGLQLAARAMDNRMFSILANLGGSTPLGPSCGLSGFWGPDGFRMKGAAGTGTEVITAILQRSALRRYR